MLFNIRGSYQIVINDIAVEPISNLFPHSFEYKIGENGDWISAPEGAPFSYPATPQFAVFDIYGDVEPTNDLVYFRIDLRDYGYENYLETNIVGEVQPFINGSFIVNEASPIQFSYTPSCPETGGQEVFGTCYNINNTTDVNIDLGGEELAFELDDSGRALICNLENLEEIIITNTLIGEIPPCIGEMPNLQILDL